MRENQPLVSIIMPVYNCERFLSKSIESVISQSYKNWELLIVDDGSKDKSVSIVEAYVEKDSRIKLYINESEEHGPGIARNYGIERIHGKYTYFIDADDWIEKDLLQDTVTLAEKMNADIVPFGFVIENNGKKINKKLDPIGDYEFNDFKKIADKIVRGTWRECFELIRSELLKDIRHSNYKTGEDLCFQMDLLCNVRRVCGIEREYYHYRIMEGSTSHSNQWDDIFMESNIAVWEKEKEFLEYCGLNEDSQMMKNMAFERYTWCMYCLCQKRCSLTLREKYNQIKYVADKMQIKKFKRKFDCTNYPGIRRIAKLFVKYNLEILMIIVGTLYFKYVERISDKIKLWKGLEY